MQQIQEQPDPHEISRKGQRVLEAISQELEKQHFGRFIVIEADSGDYFIGDTVIEAISKAEVQYPNRHFFLKRIGFRAVYFIGASQ